MFLQVSGGFAAKPAREAGAEEGGASGTVRMRDLVMGHEPSDMRKQLRLLSQPKRYDPCGGVRFFAQLCSWGWNGENDTKYWKTSGKRNHDRVIMCCVCRYYIAIRRSLPL